MTIVVGLPATVFAITIPPIPSVKVSVNLYTSAAAKVVDPVIFGAEITPAVAVVAFVPVSATVHSALGLAVVVAVKLADRLTTVFTANTSFEGEGALIVAASVVFGFCA